MNPRTAQNYENHRSIDYVITLVWPALLVTGVLALAAAVFPGRAPLLLGAALLVLVLANFVMTHKIRAYSLRMQDRIIRLEMRLRLQKLLPVDRHWEINGLSISQLIALRFAGDEELPQLMRKVLDEKIENRNEIKRMIKEWEADDFRI